MIIFDALVIFFYWGLSCYTIAIGILLVFEFFYCVITGHVWWQG